MSPPQTRRMTRNVTKHVRNKAKLVAKGYTQEERIDYDEVFALVARIEAIRLFLAYASFKDFIVYQMDVKSALLYGKIQEEVYVCQPLGFKDPKFPDRVYKVEKALYGLHQAPRAWYETLSTYLLENGFQRGKIDKTLFIKRIKGDIILVQVYVDDIIFGATKKELCTEFKKLMHKKFQIGSMGELTFFLGIQVMKKEDRIFISQDKYVDEILKKFGFSTMKTTSTPIETSKPLLKNPEAKDVDVYLYRLMIGSLMYLTASRPDIIYLKGQPKLGLWYPKDLPFDLKAYNDSDYASASLDKKSTTGVEGEGSGQPIEPQHTPTTASPYHIEPIPNVASSSHPKKTKKHRKTKIKATKISQSSGLTILGADETVHEERRDSMERAATTTASLDAEQDSGNIIRTQSMAILNKPSPQGTGLGSGPRRQETILGGAAAQTREYKDCVDLETTNLKKRVKSLGDQEDASNHGRNMAKFDQDEGIFFPENVETQGRYGHDLEVNTASTSITTANINITTAEPVTTASVPVTTAGVSVSTAEPSNPPTITTLMEDEDLIIAQTLMEMKSEKSKEKSKEKKNQLQAELEKEARSARQREEEANVALIEEWDNMKAMMDADYELCARLQAEEQRELTIKERSKLFVELMDKRKKHFAKLRAKEIRRKPPTKAQKRNQMCTYLKNMAGFTHNQLKNKSFEEIQKAFDKTMSWINSFVPIDYEVVEGSGKKAKSSGKEAVSKKRTEIVPKDDEAVNVESLATKYPIVDWKTHILAEVKMYYEIIRADGSTKYYRIFSAMLDDFNRQDVLDLYRLVKERFETTSLEGYDRLLLRDLITLFELKNKYPLTQEMLSRMLSRRLEVDHESEMAFELLRFTISQGRIVGIKRHLNDVEVTAARYGVTTATYSYYYW
ncbi:putative ribonuclease H-like domain-containing protein [Tanacetum coccineum]